MFVMFNFSPIGDRNRTRQICTYVSANIISLN